MESENKSVILYAGSERIRIFGWSRPCVIDLGGLHIPHEGVPFMRQTDSETLERVTTVHPYVSNGSVYVLKNDIKEYDKFSLGVEVENAELVEKESRIVNGVEIVAPFYHIRKGRLTEIVGVNKDGEEKRLNLKCAGEVSLDSIKAELDSVREEVRELRRILRRNTQDHVLKMLASGETYWKNPEVAKQAESEIGKKRLNCECYKSKHDAIDAYTKEIGELVFNLHDGTSAGRFVEWLFSEKNG